MTFSKTGNKKVRRQSLQRVKTPEWAILEAATAAFFRCRPSRGFLCFWTMTAGRTVFQIKSVISWACEPPHTAILKMKRFFPEIHPRCQRKGEQSFIDRIGAVFPCFLCFWKPLPLSMKPVVLLNTLPHILHEVCGLAVQHITNLFQSIHGQVLH